LKVTFESHSHSAFFHVLDESDPSGAALFVGQNSDSRSAVIPVTSSDEIILELVHTPISSLYDRPFAESTIDWPLTTDPTPWPGF
jgi:hypothetical protein